MLENKVREIKVAKDDSIKVGGALLTCSWHLGALADINPDLSLQASLLAELDPIRQQVIDHCYKNKHTILTCQVGCCRSVPAMQLGKHQLSWKSQHWA